ncbi:MAG TPA: S24 family peptidase [Methylomirabilota bacterium]|nr:S24 family peptidase [Methylomirabilota bacterium]
MRNFLKAFRKASGFTLDDLAVKSGYAKSTINNFELGKTNASDEFLEKIAGILKTTPEGILKGPAPESESPLVLKEYSGPFYGATKQAPIVSWASAGYSHAYEDQGELGRVTTDCRDHNCYALYVEGDSMEPRHKAGDIIVVAPNAVPRNGDLAIVRTRDGVYFKEFHMRGLDRRYVQLNSLNPRYPPVELELDDVEKIHAVHSVVSVYRKDL